MTQFKTLQSLFFQAVELDDPDERQRFIDSACGDNHALRAELETLLACDPNISPPGGHTLSDHIVPLSRSLADDVSAHGPNTSIGGYRLLEEIGAGGMGSVFLAEREDEQFRHRVAIKLVRGFPTREVLDRFRRERELLATLRHPNIARLFDGGSTDQGQPYLVMEHIQGITLDQWCRQAQPDVRTRVRLFQALCSAVQHAHQRLIIHRDIKPANILVRPDGQPALLDFGIGKLLDEDPSNSGQTQTRAQALTPAYASPEQLQGKAASTLSDVYGLGLVLFELLSGQPLRGPGGQTTQLSASQIAAQGEPWLRLEARALRGDLDNIVRKCLREEPERRYPSAEALALDLQAWLDGRPVQAAPDSWRYRLRKFVARHPMAIGATVATIVILTGMSIRLAAERDRALEAQEQSRLDAEAAQQSADFLVDLFKLAAPENTLGEEITVRTLVGSARTELEQREFARALVKARLQRALGEIYLSVGLVRESIQSLESATTQIQHATDDSEQIEQARAFHQLARAYSAGDRFDDAVNAAERAQSLLVGLTQPAPQDEAHILVTLGVPRVHLGQFEAALENFTQAETLLERIPGDHRRIASTIKHNMGWAYRQLQDSSRAESLLKEALAIKRETQGDAHPSTLQTEEALATVEASQGQFDSAVERMRRVVSGEIKLAGGPSYRVALAHNELAYVLQDAGRYKEAEQHFRLALEQHEQMTPDGSGDMAVALNNLAVLLDHSENFAAAEPLFRRALQMRIDRNVPERAISRGKFNLVRLLIVMDRFDEAQSLLEEAMEIQRRQHASAWHEMAASQASMARLEIKRGNLEAAQFWLDQANAHGDGQAPIPITLGVMAEMEEAQGNLDGARAYTRQGLDMLLRTMPAHHPLLAKTRLRMLTLNDISDPDQAREELTAIEPIVMENLHPDGPTRRQLQRLRKQLGASMR